MIHAPQAPHQFSYTRLPAILLHYSASILFGALRCTKLNAHTGPCQSTGQMLSHGVLVIGSMASFSFIHLPPSSSIIHLFFPTTFQVVLISAFAL